MALHGLRVNSTVENNPAEAPPPSAEELMTQVQGGNLNAYQELIRRFQTRVHRVIAGYHRNPEDVMELVQDTFLRVYTARQTWECRNSFSSWLYRIAINASIDRYRRGDKGRTSSLEDVGENNLPQRSAKTGRSDGPLAKLRDAERRCLIEKAVRQLPRRQREVLSLRYFGEMQLDEIASALACPLGTVKSNLHKAVMNLKLLLIEQKEVLSYE
jgi:RNA polymerase sigma-70 factor, ECF subfamily